VERAFDPGEADGSPPWVSETTIAPWATYVLERQNRPSASVALASGMLNVAVAHLGDARKERVHITRRSSRGWCGSFPMRCLEAVNRRRAA
jgi:hypothetical protein